MRMHNKHPFHIANVLYIYSWCVDALTISDLHLINVYLVDVANPIKFGHALGLKPTTLERIKSCYFHQMDRCFTEVLAAWLERQDRPHDSPDPNWGEVMTALNSEDMTDIAHQLIQELASEYNLETMFVSS